MRHTFPPELIQKKSAELPPALLEAILSVDSANAIRDIGSKHNLPIDKLGILAEEVGWVMSGIAPTKEFISAIVDGLGISQEKANLIAREVNEKIFLPIREFMKGFHGEGWEKDMGGARTQGTRNEALGTRVAPPQTAAKPSAAPFPQIQPKSEPLIIKPLSGIREPSTENREPFDTAQSKQAVSSKQQETSNSQQREGTRNEALGTGVKGAGYSALGTRVSEQRVENRTPMSAPASAQPKLEPLIISPLPKTDLLRTTDPQLTEKLLEAKPTQPSSIPEKEPPAPIMSPIMKSLSDAHIILPSPSSTTPIAVPTPPPPRQIPAYYEQIKKEAEQELAKLQSAENGEPFDAAQGKQALGTSGGQTKVSLPTGPSPYVISVNREQVQGTGHEALGTRINEQNATPIETIMTPPSEFPPIPSTPPIISVTQPGAAEGTRDLALGTSGGGTSGQALGASTPMAQNPIKIEKKIPKPPAPEKYDADPYKEPIE